MVLNAVTAELSAISASVKHITVISKVPSRGKRKSSNAMGPIPLPESNARIIEKIIPIMRFIAAKNLKNVAHVLSLEYIATSLMTVQLLVPNRLIIECERPRSFAA